MPWICPELDGFFITIVTLPAFADSVDLSNLSWPLASAERSSVWPPPPELEGVLEAGAGVLDAAGADEVLPPPPPPQPATARAAAATPATRTVGLRIKVYLQNRVRS